MTEPTRSNRRALIEYCWRNANLTCPCGRCSCRSIDPAESARQLLTHWASFHAKFAADREEFADRMDRLNRKGEKAAMGYASTDIREGALERIAESRRHVQSVRQAVRRHRHAAVLYGRLARGERAFRCMREEAHS